MAAFGKFAWNELLTRDTKTARAFYENLLGWTSESMDMPNGGTYTVFKNGDEHVAGMMAMDGPQFENVPAHWMAYISVEDVDKHVDAAKTAGAEILGPPFDVPTVGRIAVIKDPTGAVISIIRFFEEG